MSDLISAHCAWARAAGLAPRTVGEREGWLWRAERALTPNGIESCFDYELAGFLGNPNWKPWTRVKAFDHCKAFYIWATEDDDPYLDQNPMRRLRRPKQPRGRPRPLSDDEVDALLSRAREPYRTAITLAVLTGLRVSELTQLHPEDVTEDMVFVRCAKGGSANSVWTHPAVWAYVRDFPPGRPIIEQVGGVADGRIFSMRASAYITRTLGMKGITMHRCRHTYARLLREEGADAFVLQRCLRHASVETTQTYVEASEAECRTAIRALRPISPAPC